MKQLTIKFVFILGCILAFLSCNKSSDSFVSPQGDLKLKSGEIKKLIEVDPNFQLLQDINEDMLSRMKKANQEKLEVAFELSNTEDIISLMGYSVREILEIEEKMQFAAKQLIKDYPEIKVNLDKREKNKCKACELDLPRAFKILKSNDFKPIKFRNIPKLKSESERWTCQDSSGFITCCIACAAAPGSVAVYPACVALCVVAFC